MTTSIDDADSTIAEQVRNAAVRAREAATELALVPREVKDSALLVAAELLIDGAPDLLAANERDVAAARADGVAESMIDRLSLTEERIAAMAASVRDVAGLADPIGEHVRGSVLPNGVRLRQIRVPLGVVGMIYEGRPNVTVDAAALAVKSGNAVLLRGSASAVESNAALVAVLTKALVACGLPADSVSLLPCGDRSSVHHLITARGLVDVVIPRGGAGLISTVVEQATVPTIETGVGNCHVYVDAAADLDTALRILLNSKTRRTSVCNAAETVLVHRDVAADFLPRAIAELRSAGVTVHGDDRVLELSGGSTPNLVGATEQDWDTEYLSSDLAAAVVDSLDAAVTHIRAHGTGHTEAIVTTDLRAADAFAARVDAAAVMINASTAFTDGGQFGMGAEIGISTQKTHARGPMGLAELTSTKWVVQGDGHVRSTD